MKLSFVGKIESEKELALCLLAGTMPDGSEHFFYVVTTVKKAVECYNAQETGRDYDLGRVVILKQGEGAEPPEELKQEIHEAYGLGLLSEDEAREQLKDFLADDD